MSRERVFRLSTDGLGPVAGGLVKALENPVSRLLGLGRIDDVYLGLPEGLRGEAFLDATMAAFGFSYAVSDEDMARIPKEGPLIVVANHPFGGLEGLIMAKILLAARPDVKIMANFLLRRVPELDELFIHVDPFGQADSSGANIRPLKESLAFLKSGGALGVFPSGEVSHVKVHDRRLSVSDPAWSPTVARLARRTGATVLPMFFQGRNSLLFQAMGLLHPRLRTALLPREFANKGGRRVEARIGNPVTQARLGQLVEGEDGQDELIIRYLRLRTYLLKNRSARAPRKRAALFPPKTPVRQEALIAPVGAGLMHDEIAALPEGRVLLRSGDYDVIHAVKSEIPLIMREIGRLRELTFRKVGEGTGKSSDLDAFDEYYSHLFLWNRVRHEVVGAYRLGRTDEIMSRFGPRGLYTNTLFVLTREFLNRIGPALEMGRSFVRPEYQKSYSPLLLLWKGLAQVVIREPRYRVLFGPVSITNEYKNVSRQLMARYFEGHAAHPNLSRLVKPRTPLRPKAWLRQASRTLVSNMDDLLDLLSDIETDQKGIPVLLRQYLKLGGKLLAFNVDREFSDALDGLIVVDLLETDRSQLERYMGKPGLRRFLAHHEPTGDDGLRDCA